MRKRPGRLVGALLFGEAILTVFSNEANAMLWPPHYDLVQPSKPPRLIILYFPAIELLVILRKIAVVGEFRGRHANFKNVFE